MNSAEELKVHRYLDKAVKGTATMSDDTIEQVVSHIRDSLKKQFSPQQKDFRIRMSNIGRPYCQLWFLKNKPDIPFRIPKGVRLVRIDAKTGLIAQQNTKRVLLEAFRPGSEPKGSLPVLDKPGNYENSLIKTGSGTGGLY